MVSICRLKSQVSLSKLKQFFRHQKKMVPTLHTVAKL